MRVKSIALHLISGIALCLIILFSFISPAAALAFHGGSSLTGLVELKQMAKQSTSYEVAMHNGKPTLIEFYADWCTTCQAMASTIHQLYNAKADQINFVMVNIDDPQWTPQIQRYGVTGVPQFTFLSASGEPQKTFYGRVPEAIFSEELQQLVTP